jgi:hypothetical protein
VLGFVLADAEFLLGRLDLRERLSLRRGAIEMRLAPSRARVANVPGIELAVLAKRQVALAVLVDVMCDLRLFEDACEQSL